MEVTKLTKTTEFLCITGATVLSSNEANTLLTDEERTFDSWWWLRSSIKENLFAGIVSKDGIVNKYSGCIIIAKNAVRPALKIKNLSKSDFVVGDYFEVAGYTFKIISNNLAFMIQQDIGTYCFDTETNIYENSYIKKVVDNWFEDTFSIE